jgi:hypothetical protein
MANRLGITDMATVCPFFRRWQYLVIGKTANGRRKTPIGNSNPPEAELLPLITLGA